MLSKILTLICLLCFIDYMHSEQDKIKNRPKPNIDHKMYIGYLVTPSPTRGEIKDE